MQIFPKVATVLALTTLVASVTVAIAVGGSPWSRVPILQLRDFGGVDNAQLANGELWRLVTAQFVHVSPAHMLFNVISLFALAMAVERATSSVRFALLWLASGVAGTYASIYAVRPPYDIGSGASQAIMGVAASAIVVLWRKHSTPKWLIAAVAVTLVNAIALDLVFAFRVKPGHVVGFLVGLTLAIALVPIPIDAANQTRSALRPVRVRPGRR
jgi:membrane associated rhomboid family serine protease